jgi:NAD(P)-dependent dehydrogenase (short-subunit alcohol dehydrogenase family)
MHHSLQVMTTMKRNMSAIAASSVLVGVALVSKALRRSRAMNLNGRVALVTGGSRGLGLLIARELGSQGAKLVIAARDEPELSRAKADLLARGVEVVTVVTDLSTPEEARRAVNAAVFAYGQLDVLINNAGLIMVGPFDDLSRADFDEAMAIHFWAPLFTLQAALPHMRKAGGGRIVNISSIGGKLGVPHLAAYCASKFALTGFSQSVRAELAHENILVTTVCPGLMRTGSIFNAWFKGHHRDEFAWFAVAGSLPLLSIDASRAATRIVDAARHGDAELVISWPAKLAIGAVSLLPQLTAAAAALANRFLPVRPTQGGEKSFSGWQSGSFWAPSGLTRLSERAAAQNNELPL